MDFLEFLKVLVLGIVEGITEWLPISSTGHILLLDEIFPLALREEFKEMFFVVIQLGAILAVLVFFWKTLFPFRIEKEEKTISIRKLMRTGSYAIDSGCYYVNNQGYLYFFDYATEENVIVCPRPDCSIEESSESYIAGASYFVYKDRLYVIKRDLSDSNFVRGLLIESDLDRGNRKEIASLPSYDILSFAQYGK